MSRDQERARYAYRCVAEVQEGERADYKVIVNGLGANVLRSGLAGTMSFIERNKSHATDRLLTQLARAGIPALGAPQSQGREMPALVRALDVDAYMLATREFLKVSVWFKRAVQAQSWGEP